ncbi:hypothetical protein EX30DRAFT_36132 [Ascodesmis nigricans]|uniref:Uncharacterized protein n=1 Tax=Ascodesmis nigricans TaxID=341454 RepID=A0A4S2MWP5_9PEZI|nr:hypothetical protein EX30DRAFT_36132 [Ascodesmis nigricans]
MGLCFFVWLSCFLPGLYFFFHGISWGASFVFRRVFCVGLFALVAWYLAFRGWYFYFDLFLEIYGTEIWDGIWDGGDLQGDPRRIY